MGVVGGELVRCTWIPGGNFGLIGALFIGCVGLGCIGGGLFATDIIGLFCTGGCDATEFPGRKLGGDANAVTL